MEDIKNEGSYQAEKPCQPWKRNSYGYLSKGEIVLMASRMSYRSFI